MKKLTAMFLAIVLIMGISSIPVQATEATKPTEANVTSTEVTATTAPTQEQLFLTMALMCQIRNTISVEKELDSVIKAVNELKSDAKDIQLSSTQLLAIFFYAIENSVTLSIKENGASVSCFWVYMPKAGGELYVFLNPESGSWSLTTDKRNGMVSVK